MTTQKARCPADCGVRGCGKKCQRVAQGSAGIDHWCDDHALYCERCSGSGQMSVPSDAFTPTGRRECNVCRGVGRVAAIVPPVEGTDELPKTISDEQKAAMRERGVRDGFPSLYFTIFPRMKEAAEGCGYALVIHGSAARDLDLIAVPWVNWAIKAEDLVETIRASFNGLIEAHKNPEQKPHGRVAWTIILTGGAFIDLSVIPRSVDQRVDTWKHAEMWNAINLYASTWKHPDNTSVDRQRAVVEVERLLESLLRAMR